LNALAPSQFRSSDRIDGDASPSSRTTHCPIAALQLGLHWFPEAPGGLDRFYYELVNELPAVGVESRGWVVGSSMAANETGGKVRAFASSKQSVPARLMAARAAVRKSIREHRPDLVVSHFALYTFPALGQLGNLPLVVHFQGPWAEESRVEGADRLSCMGKRLIERAVYRRADRLICLSPAFADILAHDYRIPRERIRVVHAAVDVDRFDIPETRQDARLRLGWPVGRPIVLCVRRLVRRMGLEHLIDAATRVRARVPDVLIHIAGRGAITAELQQRIDAAGLQDNVKLLGFVPDSDLPRAFRAADLSIVPSISLEGFGLVAAESLAAGTPALVTPVGGLPEVVKGLPSHLLLSGSSTEQLAEGISSALLGSHPMPSPQRCKDHVRCNFSWPVIASRVRAVYAEAIESMTNHSVRADL
jgi:glycosyltransferase involved in cell wall biosynthesis